MALILGTSNPDSLAGTADGDLVYGYNTVAGDVGVADHDTLLGLDGNDTIFGGSGNDLLNGGAGNDSLVGGTGDDTYVVDSVGDGVSESAGEGADTVQAGVSYALGPNLEHLVLTGSGNFTGTGNGANNTITGNTGNNLLDGGAGDDTLDGGAGFDTLLGGAGNDLLVGGSGGTLFTIGRASTTSVDEQANTGGFSGSQSPALSADGRYVAFQSGANNLVAGDTNGLIDLFVKDLQTGITTRVSTDSSGGQANNMSNFAALSADGQFVVFHTNATNLVAGDTNNQQDIILKDLVAGTTTRVSTDSVGTQANSASIYGTISADGHYAAFESFATNLVAGDTNGSVDVFVKDLQTGTTTRVSTDSGGGQGIGDSGNAALSADGRFVAFDSSASSLVAGDVNGATDVFVKDQVTGITTLVSTATGGAQANNFTFNAAISGDGRFVAFESVATNLVAGDTNGTYDIFVKDLLTGVTTLVSAAADGTRANDSSHNAAISADGRFVAFHSYATNLVAGDINGYADIYVKDLLTGTVTRMSLAGDGTPSNDGSFRPAISADGHIVAFDSNATNLVGGDSNTVADIFVVAEPVAGDDTLDGGDGDDTLDGGVGNDTLNGGAGYDVMLGGADNDRVLGGVGADNLQGNAGNDTLIGGEGTGTDTLDDADTLDGGAGNDSLSGGYGADNALAGDGDDTVIGGAGNDTLSGGTGDDVMFGSTDNDNVLGGLGADNLQGNAGNDTLAGGDAAGTDSLDAGDTLDGGAGNDSLSGGFGADSLLGGDGNDTLEGGVGNDSLVGGLGDDTLNGGPDRPPGYSVKIGTEIPGGPGDDFLDGGAGNDSLSGGDGADNIQGGDGNDTLVGGAYNDTLLGGAGDDIYVVTLGNGTDLITDFSDGDLVDVTGATLLLPFQSGNGASVLINQVQVSSSGGITTLHIGLNDVPGPDASVQIAGTFGASEFRLVGGDIAINHIPVVANLIPDQGAAIDGAFSFAFATNTFNDVDAGDSLTYTATQAEGSALPEWLTFTAETRTFSGAPANGDVGNFDVKVTATDSGALSAFDTFTIAVTNTNHAPVLLYPVWDQWASEDHLYSVDISTHFDDIDAGDILTYRAEIDSDGDGEFDDPMPAWLGFDSIGGVFSGAPADADVGTISVRVTATDTIGTSVSDEFNLAVFNTSDAPTLVGAIADDTISEDVPFTLDVSSNFADDDIDSGDFLTYSVSGPGWLVIDSITGILTGTPTNDDVGSADVTVTVRDVSWTSISDTFSLTIENVNDAPIVTPGGTLDWTFDGDGTVRTELGHSSGAFAVILQPDEKIVAAGYARGDINNDIALVRYNKDGSLDFSFDGDGKVVTHSETDVDYASDVVLQPDGKILVAGTRDDGYPTYNSAGFKLVRYNADGSLDSTFGEDGAVVTQLTLFDDVASSILLQPDGKILVAGSMSYFADDCALVRYNADGSLDTTFSGDGQLTFSFAPGADQVSSAVLQPDGKILVAGTTFIPGLGDDFAVARFSPDGTLDSSFGVGGKVTTDFGGNDSGRDLTLLPDGKFLIAGSSIDGPAGFDFALARYNADGSLDADFGTGGKVLTDFGSSYSSWDLATSVLVQFDGRILVGGLAPGANGSFDFALARYDADGGLDASFGSDGLITVDFGLSTDELLEFALQRDGSIVAVGDSTVLYNSQLSVIRVMGGGLPDQTVAEDSVFNFSVPASFFTDVDVGDTLTYNATLENGSDLPSWLNFNPGTLGFSGTPLNADVGTINVKVIATDTSNASGFDIFAINVTNTNDAPTVANPIPDRLAAEDSAFSFTFAANVFTDVDAGDTLSYVAAQSDGTSLPDWLAFNAATRTFSGTPAGTDAGTLSVKVAAFDGHGGSAFDTFNITTVAGDNDAPTVAHHIANQAASEADFYSFTFASNTFADADVGDTLTFSAVLANNGPLPGWLAFDPDTRAFSGTPGRDDVGGTQVKVIAADGHGGAASDQFTLTVTPDPTQGGEGNDVIAGTAGDDSLGGGGGDDSILGGDGGDTLIGNAGNDTLSGGTGNDLIFGSADNDNVQGGAGGDNLQGNGGNDTLTGGDGTGTDTLDAGDTLDGGAGNDSLSGGYGADNLLAGDGNDTLVGGADYDTLNGGIGNDLAFGSLGEDNVLGGIGADNLQGNGGNDTLVGGDGTGLDSLDGADTLDGGAGNDSLSGGYGADNLLGADGNDTLIGGAGNDALNGGAGNDLSFGSLGDDNVLGGVGSDNLQGNAGSDTLVGGDGTGLDTLDAGDTLDGGAGNDSLSGGFGADSLIGADGNDTLVGNAGNDVQNGGTGNDLIFGSTGSDTLIGGAGNDTMQGNADTDTFRYDATTLNTLDVAAGQADLVSATAVGDLISLLGLTDELTIAGTALSALTANAAVGGALDATNNIAFTGGILQIDLDGNDTFNALNDFQLQLTGVTTVTYNSTDDLFHLS